MRKVDRNRLYTEVGERIRRLRERHEQTQAQFSAKVGVERTSVTNIEKGAQRATLHFLYRVAQEFNASLNDLLPEVGDAGIQEGSVTALESIRVGRHNRNVPPPVKSMYESMGRAK